ncbi:probable metal-dependent peptidase [uncultured Candidatus Thioglobus sp.]|nr:probable metal-dependent peptidase [uncultured Candidatus Thioglobus sp.]
MSIAIFIIVLCLLLFLPQVWCRHVLKKYAVENDNICGTGGELAEYLVDVLALEEVQIEEGLRHENYYAPDKKLIKLSPENMHGKSLVAVAVAAHEVGHVIQHKLNYRPFVIRTRLVKFVGYFEKLASILLISAPFIAFLTRTPAISIIMLICGLSAMLLPVLVHFCTLPVEWDASFNRALPVLINGEYISDSAIPIVKRILTAAALTYVASALASLLNFYRWLAILRR